MKSNLKIRSEHYEALKSAIQKVVTKESVEEHREYLTSPNNPQPSKDPEKRLRFDIFYKCRMSSEWVRDVYSYLNDDHLDSALKLIMKELDLGSEK